MVRSARWLPLAAATAALLVACSGRDDRPPSIADGYGGGGGVSGGAGQPGSAGSAGTISFGPIEVDPDSGCGYTFVDARRDPSRLYFVVDRSGSMSDAIEGVTKYAAVRAGLTSLVQKVGWRAEIGATVFPGLTGDQCAPGSEVFALRAGDPRSYLEEGKTGPITQGFAKAINIAQTGGTPTGKTLASLVPKLSKLGPNTYVILATDGGPNCNSEIACGGDRCMLNIEQAPICQAPNCCDPEASPEFSPVNCLDADSTLAAVQQLADAGVKTIVVGIPGSDVYGTLLDLMAVAGGAPRPGSPRYYRVENLGDLESLLLQIGDQVTVSCDVTLSEPPAHRELVNVFLDKTLVPADPDNGWAWSGDDRLTLHGKPCDDLLAGVYEAVQVIVGCPTEIGPID